MKAEERVKTVAHSRFLGNFTSMVSHKKSLGQDV